MTPTQKLIEELRPMWADESTQTFPQITEPIDPPLTLAELAKRVAAIEEHIDLIVLPDINKHAAILNLKEENENLVQQVRNLYEQNQKLRAENKRLAEIIRGFTEQSVSVSHGQ